MIGAVNYALRALATEPFPLEQVRALRGSGWEGNLDNLRQARVSRLTARPQIDCLIAAIAIDYDVPLLHADRDVDALAQSSRLRLDEHEEVLIRVNAGFQLIPMETSPP